MGRENKVMEEETAKEKSGKRRQGNARGKHSDERTVSK
jgi:hypothetical protein